MQFPQRILLPGWGRGFDAILSHQRPLDPSAAVSKNRTAQSGLRAAPSRNNFPHAKRPSKMSAETNKPVLPHWLKIVLIGRRPRVTVLRIVLTAGVLVLTARFLLLPIRVQGPSMSPTYADNGVNLVNRLAYTFHEPRRGDVVAIRLAGPSLMLMKRIVGLPGETVEFAGGRVFINGRLLDEPYVKHSCRWELPPQKLQTNEFFVVGDNRSMRAADHTFGAATRERILGRVLL